MRPQTRSKVLWALWMTGGGIATALVVWALTDSVGWSLVALLASGPVLNTIGQMVVQPARAARGTARDRERDRTG